VATLIIFRSRRINSSKTSLCLPVEGGRCRRLSASSRGTSNTIGLGAQPLPSLDVHQRFVVPSSCLSTTPADDEADRWMSRTYTDVHQRSCLSFVFQRTVKRIPPLPKRYAYHGPLLVAWSPAVDIIINTIMYLVYNTLFTVYTIRYVQANTCCLIPTAYCTSVSRVHHDS
jgi:hypothetical protein